MNTIYETILHLACKNKNIDLIKYLISLKKFDINDKNILFTFPDKI